MILGNFPLYFLSTAGAADLTGHFETSSLDCSPNGFAPTFEYSTQDQNQEFKFDIILGIYILLIDFSLAFI